MGAQKDVIARAIPTERIKMAPTAVLALTPALSLKTQASIQASLVPTASHAHWMPLLKLVWTKTARQDATQRATPMVRIRMEWLVVIALQPLAPSSITQASIQASLVQTESSAKKTRFLIYPLTKMAHLDATAL